LAQLTAQGAVVRHFSTHAGVCVESCNIRDAGLNAQCEAGGKLVSVVDFVKANTPRVIRRVSRNIRLQVGWASNARQSYDHTRDQCVFETMIAARLRGANRSERLTLYGEVYDEYGRAFPEVVSDSSDANVRYELAFTRRFMPPDAIVAEVGPGRCEFAIALAAHCKVIYGVDVADLPLTVSRPPNFRHVLTNGVQIPLPDDSIDLVISNQLMEHLHPDDAADQLHEILRIMKAGGSYICVTPNRLHGPHDSSARFDDLPCPVADGTFVANGLHLKEYTNSELSQLFLAAGFRRARHFTGARGVYIEVPSGMMFFSERCARHIPLRLRKRSRLLRAMVGVRLVADK
jgi:SAM-dependent methyltransferase